MAKRSKMSRKRSRRLFSKTASRTHVKNIRSSRPKRGGNRL